MNNKLSILKAAWLGILLVAGICCAGAYAGAADETTAATYCPPEDNSFLINKVILGPDYENRVTRYQIDYCDDGRHWRVAYRGETIGKTPVTLSFPQVTGTKARLLIMTATGWPTVFEMGIYHENTAVGVK